MWVCLNLSCVLCVIWCVLFSGTESGCSFTSVRKAGVCGLATIGVKVCMLEVPLDKNFLMVC